MMCVSFLLFLFSSALSSSCDFLVPVHFSFHFPLVVWFWEWLRGFPLPFLSSCRVFLPQSFHRHLFFLPFHKPIPFTLLFASSSSILLLVGSDADLISSYRSKSRSSMMTQRSPRGQGAKAPFCTISNTVLARFWQRTGRNWCIRLGELCLPHMEEIILKVLWWRRIMQAIRLRICCLRTLTGKTKGGLQRGATGEMEKSMTTVRECQQTGMLMQKGRHIHMGGRSHGYSPFRRLDVGDLFINKTWLGNHRVCLLCHACHWTILEGFLDFAALVIGRPLLSPIHKGDHSPNMAVPLRELPREN